MEQTGTFTMFLFTNGIIWTEKQKEKVFCNKANSDGKFSARKFEFSGKTEQINIDLDNNF